MENITVEEWRWGGGEERLNTSFYSAAQRENAGQRSAAGAELVHWIPLEPTQCSAVQKQAGKRGEKLWERRKENAKKEKNSELGKKLKQWTVEEEKRKGGKYSEKKRNSEKRCRRYSTRLTTSGLCTSQ